MIASVGVVVVLILAAWFALRAGRRAFAGELVGEISEILDVIDSHDAERKLLEYAAGGGACRVLPRLPLMVFEKSAIWLPILGLHGARVVASFYASAGALNEELAVLSGSQSAESGTTGDQCASSRLAHTVELGEQALLALRAVVARRRQALISRS